MKPGTIVRVKKDSHYYKSFCRKIGSDITVVVDPDKYRTLSYFVTIRVRNGEGNKSTPLMNTFNVDVKFLESCARVKEEDIEDTIKLLSL